MFLLSNNVKRLSTNSCTIKWVSYEVLYVERDAFDTPEFIKAVKFCFFFVCFIFTMKNK